MTTLREINTQWGGSSGGVHFSVMYFDASVAVASQRTALQTFWTAIKPILSPRWGYTILTTGRELDDATGTLTGAWTESSTKNGVGTGGTEQVADASQALIQWRTATIVNGRFLRGRTFIPGLQSASLSSGNLLAASQTVIQNAANALIASATALEIWHRPITGSGGSSDAVSTATVWGELAVLRKRRG